MDSKESTSMTNSTKSECEEKNKNLKGTPRQVGQGDNDEKLFTCPTQNSNCVPLNGSRSKLGSTHYKESGSHSCSSSERSLDNSKHACSSNQSNTVNKVNSIDGLSEAATAGSSRSSSTNNGLDINEGQCQRYKVCTDRASGSTQPSTSGTSKSSDNDVYINKESRKRPSSLKLNRPNLDDDSSSDTGNDDYSLGSEDGCIYTYRGGEHLADLPSSFFSLDMGLPLDRHLPMPLNYQVQQAGGNAASRASSPDMDFLEMDFDPGPSCEVDTGDESSPDADLEAACNMPEESEPVVPPVPARGPTPTPEHSAGPSRQVPPPVPVPPAPQEEPPCPSTQPSTSRSVPAIPTIETDTHHMYGPYLTHINARGEHLLVRRTMSHWSPPASVHLVNGHLVAQKDSNNSIEEYPEGSLAVSLNRVRYMYEVNQPITPAASYHLMMAKKLIGEKTKDEGQCSSASGDSELPCSSTSSVSCVEAPRVMVWPEKEACERQVTQIGVSACGATAVVNVFNALGVPVNIERINSSIGTRLRANNAPLPRYLLSRAVAGCTVADLVSGIQRSSGGLVTARFFHTYPERAVSLSHWLADWISWGAVPILTLNLQRGCEGEAPDAWHHQMVFGVAARGVYLCNPLECVRESSLWARLCSPPELLVRARDVACRFTPATDLSPLLHVPDQRFHTMNVLGQVCNVLREWRAGGWQEANTRTRYVRLPAAYQPGVTLAALTGSDAHRRLLAAPSLPVLAHHPS